MLIITLLLLGYILLGIIVDVWVHLANPIVYWDPRDAVKSHFSVAAVWPVVLLAIVLAR